MKGRFITVLIVIVLSCQSALAASDQISIASFNIQILGKTKANKQDVLHDIVKIMKNYDVIAVQEIRDKTSEAVTKLKDALNADGEEYKYVIGPRVGRSSSKEQYAVFYKSKKIEYISNYTYEDQDDVFQREPLIVQLKARNAKFRFALAVIHTEPDHATEEIIALDEVVKDAQVKLGEKDIIVLGDYNADCNYYNEDSSNAFTASNYTWLITNDLDTNVADTSCTYDRIVLTGSVKEDYANKSGVYKYENDLGLNRSQVKAISDHYPVYSYFYTNKDTD